MKKRLLSILLCLVMMVGLLSGVASAEGTTPITSLKFTLSGYTLGAKALELKLTKDPGDVGIDIESVKVLKRGNSLEIVDPNEIFVPEMTYSVVIKLKARDGFDITTLTKENVKATGADIEKTELFQIAGHPENERYVTFHFKPFDYLPVKDVAVTVARRGDNGGGALLHCDRSSASRNDPHKLGDNQTRGLLQRREHLCGRRGLRIQSIYHSAGAL